MTAAVSFQVVRDGGVTTVIQRYGSRTHVMGNPAAMPLSPVTEWIGRRLVAVHASQLAAGATS